MSSWFTHGLSSSYIDAVCMDHSSLFLWGREAHGSLPIWALIGGLWTFISAHGAFRTIFFCLRQLEIARLVRIRPYNALTFLAFLPQLCQLQQIAWTTGDSQISTNSTIQCTDLSWSTHRVQYSLLDLPIRAIIMVLWTFLWCSCHF